MICHGTLEPAFAGDRHGLMPAHPPRRPQRLLALHGQREAFDAAAVMSSVPSISISIFDSRARRVISKFRVVSTLRYQRFPTGVAVLVGSKVVVHRAGVWDACK
eukprot:1195273-Prorocentrum_minimum.AAC.13